MVVWVIKIKDEWKKCCSNKSYEFSTGVPVNDNYIIQPILPNKNINEGNSEQNKNNVIVGFNDNKKTVN